MSYDGCKIIELRQFCTQRCLAVDSKIGKQDLIQRVEVEDKQATFIRLLDLPAELRNRIYTLHVEEFGDLEMPLPPPITEVSCQLRHETLSLFHQSCRLFVDVFKRVYLNWNPTIPMSTMMSDIRLPFSRNTKKFFLSAPEERVGNIRKVLLQGVVYVGKNSIVTEWYVDFTAGGEQVHIHTGEVIYRGEEKTQGYAAAREKVEARMRTVLEAIASRKGWKKLQKEDLETLRLMFKADAGKFVR